MEFALSGKDIFLIATILSTLISMYFALKYKTQKNEDKNEETQDSFKSFKDFVYKELKDIDGQLKNISNSLHDMLNKDEAENKYMSKKEHDLVMKNINLQLLTIVEKLDEIKKDK